MALAGGCGSSSYTPALGQPSFEPMMKELDCIFDEFNVGGKVRFEYDTEIYVGRLT